MAVCRSIARQATLLALSVSWLVPRASSQDVCSSTPVAAVLQGGSPGTYGEPVLELGGEPLVGFPFSFRVSNALEGAPGLLAASPTQAPVFIPGFQATIYPAFPFALVPFTVGPDGESPPLFPTASLPYQFCGDPVVAQAVIVDPLAQRGVAFTDGLDVLVGGLDLSGPPPGAPVPPAPVLDPHATLTDQPKVTLAGVASGAVSVSIEGPAGLVTAAVFGDLFSAEVFLAPDQINHLFLTAVSDLGAKSAPAATAITRDNQSPFLFIDFPVDGQVFTTPEIDVAGRVGDTLSGFMGLTVTVNGQAAVVDPGIGSNGTYVASGVPLAPNDATLITVTAQDMFGNSAVKQITVAHADATGAVMTVAGGNGQQGTVATLLPAPLTVLVTKTDGVTPFEGKTLTFEVTKSNGVLAATPGGATSQKLQVKTDAAGLAQAWWTLGSDAGCGNNRAKVTSKDINGSVFFCASATSAPADQIAVGMGNGQRGETGAPLPEPIRVWVSDGENPAGGVPVTFTVTAGGGTVGGLAEVVVLTDLTGHAEASLSLGPDPGVNEVTASFPLQPGLPATFRALGIERDETQPTSFRGLVLDNARRPIGGAACTLTVAGVSQTTLSDVNGQFTFADTLAAGPGGLRVEGLVATTLAGEPIPPASFPDLHYNVVLVANAENQLPVPVLLPALDPSNAKAYSTTADTLLTVAGIEGLAMRVKAGSMSLANGQPATDGQLVSLNQVHFDEIPMPLPDGAGPPFAWTLQPGGAEFDPPVTIEMPNMAGLPPGSVCYFLSFNHALEMFEIVASGHVEADGSKMVTDPGAGIATAGWGGFCPPYPQPTNVQNCAGQSFWGTIKTGANLILDVAAAFGKLNEKIQCGKSLVDLNESFSNEQWKPMKSDGVLTDAELAQLSEKALEIKETLVACVGAFVPAQDPCKLTSKLGTAANTLSAGISAATQSNAVSLQLRL